MKNIFYLLVLVFAVVFFATPTVSNAQTAADTLTVFATPLALDNVIASDTLAGGAQKHKVYKLVSRDTTYLYQGAITIKSSVTIIGVLNSSTGRPPCIQPAVLSNNSIPGSLFLFNGKGTKAYVKNLYLLGLSTNGSASGDGVAIQVIADSIKLYVDNVVFEEWQTFAIGYNGNWDSFFITNCKFRNMVHPNQWYIGEVLRNMWPGAAYTDTVLMKYNTLLCVNGYAAAPVTKYYERYFDFSHNNVIYTFKNPFFIFNVTDAKINSNVFYGAWAGAISKTEYPWWDQLWSPEIGSIIDFDSLNVDNAKMSDPADSASFNSNWSTTRWLAEAKRKIEVKNNVYFWPDTLKNYWKKWDDTAHVDSVYTPTWMNTRTTAMFTDKTHWPNVVQSGNLEVDPTFGTSIPAVLTQATNGLFAWFKLCRTNALSTTYWGYSRTQVGAAANWIPTWPLPEATHMAYTNTTAKNNSGDGIPTGDPWWFKSGPTGVVADLQSVPKSFSLSAAYPNPFNPSTNIQYSLVQPGVTSLRVYNVLGQLVKTIVNNVHQDAGTYHVTVDMANATSGVYYYLLEQGGNRIARKMMLLK